MTRRELINPPKCDETVVRSPVCLETATDDSDVSVVRLETALAHCHVLVRRVLSCMFLQALFHRCSWLHLYPSTFGVEMI
jgi:hypothetical protein